MKKLIPILSLILILALLPLSAIAAQSADPTEGIRTATGLSPLEETIYCGLMATEERIDLSALGASGEEVTAAMQHLLDSVPELFHVSHSFSYSATAVVPSYTIEGDALAAARAEYLFAIDRIADTRSNRSCSTMKSKNSPVSGASSWYISCAFSTM